MNQDYESVWERLHLAAATLARDTDDIRNRLLDACITLIPLRVDDFPEEAQAEFRAIMRETTPVEAKAGEGDLIATIRRMTEATAGSYAKRIIALYEKAERERIIRDQERPTFEPD